MAKTSLKLHSEKVQLEQQAAERRSRQQQWQAEHREFIAAYNQVVEEEGLPLDSWRMF